MPTATRPAANTAVRMTIENGGHDQGRVLVSSEKTNFFLFKFVKFPTRPLIKTGVRLKSCTIHTIFCLPEVGVRDQRLPHTFHRFLHFELLSGGPFDENPLSKWREAGRKRGERRARLKISGPTVCIPSPPGACPGLARRRSCRAARARGSKMSVQVTQKCSSVGGTRSTLAVGRGGVRRAPDTAVAPVCRWGPLLSPLLGPCGRGREPALECGCRGIESCPAPKG
jgi:hypothetical protein